MQIHVMAATLGSLDYRRITQPLPRRFGRTRLGIARIALQLWTRSKSWLPPRGRTGPSPAAGSKQRRRRLSARPPRPPARSPAAAAGKGDLARFLRGRNPPLPNHQASRSGRRLKGAGLDASTLRPFELALGSFFAT